MVVFSLLFVWLLAMEPKVTNIVDSTDLAQYRNVPKTNWMQVFLWLVVGIMCPVHVPFVVWDHRWVASIGVVNFVADVMLYVYTCVGLLPHILAWKYKPCFFGNPDLLWWRSKIFQSSPHQLGIIP